MAVYHDLLDKKIIVADLVQEKMCAANKGASGAQGDEDYRQQLKSYSHFFNRLVEMVPAKYYLENPHEDQMQIKYMKKSVQADAKKERKEAAKKRKREKLDPDRAQTALDVQVGPTIDLILVVCFNICLKD